MKKAIQTDLFGNPIPDSNEADRNKKGDAVSSPAFDERPAKQIALPPIDELQKMVNSLDRFPLYEIKELLEGFVDYARKYRLYYIDPIGQEKCPEAIRIIITSKEKKCKQNWLEFAAILYNHRNFHLFYEEMTEREKELMQLVIEKHFVPEDEVTKLLGHGIKTDNLGRFYYFHPGFLLPHLRLWFATEGRVVCDPEETGFSYNNYAHCLCLQPLVAGEIIKALHPEYHAPEALETLPADSQLVTYQGETAIHTILPIIKAAFQTKQLKFGVSNCGVAAVKRTAIMTNIKEFFPDTTGDQIAAHLLVNLYGLDATVTCAANSTIENDVKKLITDMNQLAPYLTPIILWNIKGFRKAQLENGCCKFMIQDILKTLRTFAKGQKWLKADELCHKVRFINWTPDESTLWMDGDEYDKLRIYNTHKEKYVYSDSIISQITNPFIKGFMFMMAVFGMTEIAYDKEPAPDASCYYDALKYVRLTPLGEYALSMTTEYEKPKTKEDTEKFFEVYEDNLMVRMLKEDNPYASVLTNIGKSISKKLYKVSYESFLDGCTCKKDITDRIHLFKEYICPELPANWLQFFKDLEKHSRPLKEVRKKYTLLQIPKDDKELQRIIISDPEIRKYTLKAEGFILLVETDYKDKVVKALKKHGFLV